MRTVGIRSTEPRLPIRPATLSYFGLNQAVSSEWKLGTIDDRPKREARSNSGDAACLSQSLAQKHLVIRHCLDDDTHLIVAFARHEVAFHHLGPLRDGTLKFGQRGIVLFGQ